MNTREKLLRFQVSPEGAACSFVDRLGRENRWTMDFAERVYGEYLRFLYLAHLGEIPVTPSEPVDQAWHLHLCYSKSYWKDLCGDLLGRNLHHHPTKGGAEEGERYRAQYRATLGLYQRVFGQDPPTDIWPPVRERFHPSDRFVRVNLRESLVIPKKWVRISAMATAATLLLTGCGQLIRDVAEGDVVSLVILVLLAFGVIWLLGKLRGKNGNGGGGCGGSCGGGCGGGGCGSGCGGGCGGGD